MFLGNPTRRSFSSLLRRANILAGFLLGIAFFLPGSPVHAQAIIATVNGNPITDIDVDERMKLLRVLHQPASRDAALQSMIDDTLKLDETGKYKLKASDAEIGQQISREAVQLKMAPEALMVALEGAGIPEQHIKDHFAADYQFLTLIEAYNKGVEASETQVREELARSGGKSAAGVDYKVNQVIFTIFPSASPAEIAARMKAAEQFRTRFTDCDSGLSAARSMEDVAVRETITRNSLQLSEGMRQVLDKTPVGHLTAPQRTVDGIEMIAVCSKGTSSDDTALRDQISQKLLSAQIEADAARKLKEVRSYAVIVVKK